LEKPDSHGGQRCASASGGGLDVYQRGFADWLFGLINVKCFSRVCRQHPPHCKKPEEGVMLEPVKLDDFFIVFFSAASVILFGASYALMFAWSRMKDRPRLMMLAYAAYAGLVLSVITLALAANLFHNTFWGVIVFLMLAGYLLAPHAIWHLCVGTHAEEHDDQVAHI
jgi:hypothetical protein